MQDFSDGFAGAIRFFDQLYVPVPYELNKIAFFLVKSVISFEIKTTLYFQRIMSNLQLLKQIDLPFRVLP